MLSAVYAITAATVRVNYQPQDYAVLEPSVFVTVHGEVTNVSVAHVKEVIAGLGMVHTGLDLTFPSGHVGKKFALLVLGV